MDWDEQAATWDDDEAVRAYASGVRGCIAAEFSPAQLRELRVLDFGCGTGVLTEALAEDCAETVGLEPAPKMLAVLEQKRQDRGWSGVSPVCGTLETAGSHPALARPFDLVVASSVCAFVPDYPATLGRLRALLRPGGLFMQFDWERNDADAEPFGFTPLEMRSALEAAGLAEVTVGTGFSTPFGEVTMAPLLGRGRAPGRS